MDGWICLMTLIQYIWVFSLELHPSDAEKMSGVDEETAAVIHGKHSLNRKNETRGMRYESVN
jgi:hypothetical protein